MRRTELAFIVAAMAAVTFLAVRAERLPDEPQPIAWDKEPCAHCHMLVGEPRFAAQLVTRDGAVMSFDDPGCLLRYVAERRPAIHRTWFHHVDEDRWLRGEAAGFRRVEGTPMGYGLGAVAAPGDVTLVQARAEVVK